MPLETVNRPMVNYDPVYMLLHCNVNALSTGSQFKSQHCPNFAVWGGMVPPLPLAEGPRVAGARPGPRQPELRSNEILDAAASLFVEKGVAATSIDDIVERAGVAKGTFYHYFSDRTAMLDALRERYAERFADEAIRADEACERHDWNGRLNAWISAVSEAYISSYALHDAIFHDPVILKRCPMSQLVVVQNLAILIEQGQDVGIWEADCPLSTAVCMFHALHGTFDEAIAMESDTDILVPRLSKLFRRMLMP